MNRFTKTSLTHYFIGASILSMCITLSFAVVELTERSPIMWIFWIVLVHVFARFTATVGDKTAKTKAALEELENR